MKPHIQKGEGHLEDSPELLRRPHRGTADERVDQELDSLILCVRMARQLNHMRLMDDRSVVHEDGWKKTIGKN